MIYSAESILFLLAATLLGMGFREIGFTETNVVLLYILAVFITASLTRGYLWGILSSVAATFTFNYFFTKPYHSLQFYDAGYMVTFAVMTVVALVTSALTSREKENAKKKPWNGNGRHRPCIFLPAILRKPRSSPMLRKQPYPS